MTDNADADAVGYNPPLSLWRLVEQHVDVHERDEIKSTLGGGVVDETLELHNELEAFLEIWRDCRHSANLTEQSKTIRFPEPPGVRDRLIQEIKFFVENVREKAQEQGRDEESTLKNCNQTILNYAINESSSFDCEPWSRPQSVIGRDGRDTPSYRNGSPASDRVSASTCTFSTLSEDVEAMAEKLNVLKIDEVVLHLRSYLGEERELLVQDLRFLQECIEQENDLASSLTQEITEPTISELRGERLRLEKEMLSDVFTHQKSLHTGGFTSLKPVSAKKRTAVLPSSGPLKAVHLTAPDGIVLTGNVPDSLVAKTQQKLCEHPTTNTGHQSYIVQLGNSGSERMQSAKHGREHTVLVPKPTSASGRPSSAIKFRSMISNARSGGGE